MGGGSGERVAKGRDESRGRRKTHRRTCAEERCWRGGGWRAWWYGRRGSWSGRNHLMRFYVMFGDYLDGLAEECRPLTAI